MILQGLTYSCQSFQIGFLRLCIKTTEWPCKQHFVLVFVDFPAYRRFLPSKFVSVEQEFSRPAGLEIFGNSIHFQWILIVGEILKRRETTHSTREISFVVT